MSFAELAIAVLLLLLTPGPTNTLILLAGAERGLGGAARLIPRRGRWKTFGRFS